MARITWPEHLWWSQETLGACHDTLAAITSLTGIAVEGLEKDDVDIK